MDRKHNPEHIHQFSTIADLCYDLSRIPSNPEEICEAMYLACAQFTGIDLFIVGLFEKTDFSPIFCISEGEKQQYLPAVLPEASSIFQRLLDQKSPQFFDSSQGDPLLEYPYSDETSVQCLYGIIFPLLSGNHLWGAVGIFNNNKAYKPGLLYNSLLILNTTASGLLKHTLSLQEFQTRDYEDLILRNLIQIFISDAPLQDRIELALDFIGEILQPYELCLHLNNQSVLETLAATSSFHNTEGSTDYDPTLSQQAAAKKKVKFYPPDKEPVRQVCIPIKSGKNFPYILEIRNPSPEGFEKSHITLLTNLSRLFVFPLVENHLESINQQQEWTTTVLTEVASHAASSVDTADALQAVLQLLILLAGVEWAVIYHFYNGSTASPGPSAGLDKHKRKQYEESILSLDLSVIPDEIERGCLFEFPLPDQLASIFTTASTYAIAFYEERTISSLLLIPAKDNLLHRSDLFEGIGHQIQLRLSNERLIEKTVRQREMERELLLARKIQESFLPGKTPSIAGWDISCSWQAARQVGGDFYDFLISSPVDSNQASFDFVIADVSGKGMPASLYMALSRTLLRHIASNNSEPGKILTHLNRSLFSTTSVEHFISMFYGCWDTRENVLHYANAGHNPPILVGPSGDYLILDRHDMVLGIEQASTYASFSIQFPPDYMLITYTDGVTEAEASPGNFYGINQLLELSTTISPWSSSRAVEQICNAVDTFSNGHLKDDRTIVVLHRSAAS